MKTTAVIIQFVLFISFSSIAQQDDIYYSPEKPKKPLKNRKEYTPINQRVPEEGQSLYFMASPINAYYNSNSNEKEIYFYVFLQGGKKPTNMVLEKPNMNLSIVIDRSGSMAGSKLDNTLKAVNFMIDRFEENNTISIVQYSDNVETLVNQSYIKDKSYIKSKVNSIKAEGSTNLCGGMEKGFNCLLENEELFKKINSINRVILMSDGQANNGITNPKEINEIVSKYYEKNNLTISTIGVGSDYNEDLMTDIATNGGGSYYFINNPEDLPSIFNSEFDDMNSIVAKDVYIEIEFPSSYARLEKVYEYPYVQNLNKIKIKLTDFYSEQQKAILIKFVANNNNPSELEFKASLKYNNILKNNDLIQVNKNSVVIPSSNSEQMLTGVIPDAHMGYTLMQSSEYLKLAQQASDSRNFALANSYVKKGVECIEDHFCSVIPNPFLEDILKNFENYKTEIKELETTRDPIQFKLIQKKAKYRSYSNCSKSVRFL